MALTVYHGPANAGKTGAVYARLREHCSSGGRAALLLPSTPDVSRAIQELAREVPVGLQVTTLDGFLARAWQSVGDGRRLIRPVQRLAILEEVVRGLPLGPLARSAQTPGFLRTLARLLQEIAGDERAQVDISHRTKGVARDIQAIVEGYERTLERAGLVEERAAHRIVAARVSRAWLPDLVVAHRFTTLTRSQEAFLVAASRVAEVAVTLTYSSSVPATGAAEGLVRRLGSAGELRECAAARPYSPSAELQRVERCLGLASGECEAVPAEGAVVLSEAQGEAAEAARIAREVQDALSRGIAPGSIAVAFREVAGRLRALRSAFEEAGIEAAWDVQVPFGQTGLGRALLLLLAVCGEGGSRADVLDLLRSPYSPLDPDAVDLIDARARRIRARDAAGVKELAVRADARAREFLRRAEALSRSPLGPSVLRQWHRFVAEMLGRAWPGAPVFDLEGLLDAGAQRVFVEALEGLVDAGAPRATRAAAALRESLVTVTPEERGDRVQVMSVTRLRGRRYACVILGGLAAGEFPRAVREDALLAPDVVEGLRSMGLDAEPRLSVADERLLFYQAVTRASERLVLSRQTHDDDGEERAASPFWEELLDLYRDPATGEWYAGEPPRRFLGLDGFALDPDAPTSLRRRLRAAAQGTPPAGELTELCRVRLEHARYRVRTHPTTVGGDVAQELAQRDVFSVSDIELYLQCPFRWYVERILRPGALDADVDPATVGRLAHGVLKRFYDEYVGSTGAARVTEATLDRALAILRGVVAAGMAEAGEVDLVERVSLARAMRGVERLVRADATFLPGMSPTHHEWAFGLEDDAEAEEIGTFRLKGRIDRLDTDGTRLVVTDYKLGRVTASRARAAFEREGLVQLPLYALVASRRLGLEIAGGIYRGIGNGQARGFVRDDVDGTGFTSTDRVPRGEIDELVRSAIAQAEGAVAGMRAGEIPARPRQRPCPEYCTARPFCPGAGGADG